MTLRGIFIALVKENVHAYIAFVVKHAGDTFELEIIKIWGRTCFRSGSDSGPNCRITDTFMHHLGGDAFQENIGMKVETAPTRVSSHDAVTMSDILIFVEVVR